MKRVVSAAATNRLSQVEIEKSYRETLANSEETLGVANAARFEVLMYCTCGYIIAYLQME